MAIEDHGSIYQASLASLRYGQSLASNLHISHALFADFERGLIMSFGLYFTIYDESLILGHRQLNNRSHRSYILISRPLSVSCPRSFDQCTITPICRRSVSEARAFTL